MAWPGNGPQEKFYRALMTLQEVRGEDEAIRILEEELQRCRVVKEYRENRRDLAAAAAREAKLVARLRKQADALRFYADDPLTGLVARTTLAEIAAEGESPDDE